MSKAVIALTVCAVALCSASRVVAQTTAAPDTTRSSELREPTRAVRAPVSRAELPAYDASALRVETHIAHSRVLQGAEGKELGKLGLFRSLDIEQVVSRSPVAAAEARVYKINYMQGQIAALAGVAALASGIVLSSNGANNASTPILIVGGGIATLWGAQHLNTAFRALSRSIWWYNRELPR